MQATGCTRSSYDVVIGNQSTQRLQATTGDVDLAQSAASNAPGEPVDVYVARQPIFERTLRVYAYELLFRDGLANVYQAIDHDAASVSMLDKACVTFDFHDLVAGKPAFVNFTEKVLCAGFAQLWPVQSTVIEILETVEPTDRVIDTCQTLKKLGYRIALDDFVDEPRLTPLVDLADIIKVNFRLSPPSDRRAMSQRFARTPIDLLAEQVETRQEFDEARSLGFAYFQGYFFCKPEIVSGRSLPSFEPTALQLLQAVSRSVLDYDEVEQLIKQDVTVSYKFFRYLNSAYFGWATQITSIRHSLILLGHASVRCWMTTLALGRLCRHKPLELLTSASVRGKFCESLAPLVGLEKGRLDVFLVGALSLIDAMLDRQMADVLAQLPLSVDVKAALEGEPNPLQRVLRIAVSYERGDWEVVCRCGGRVRASGGHRAPPVSRGRQMGGRCISIVARHPPMSDSAGLSALVARRVATRCPAEKAAAHASNRSHPRHTRSVRTPGHRWVS